MELEERILENINNKNNESIFGWFGAAPPDPPKMKLPNLDQPTNDELINNSMMDEFIDVQQNKNSSSSSGGGDSGSGSDGKTNAMELDLTQWRKRQ